jgi:hypothetical protein
VNELNDIKRSLQGGGFNFRSKGKSFKVPFVSKFEFDCDCAHQKKVV